MDFDWLSEQKPTGYPTKWSQVGYRVDCSEYYKITRSCKFNNIYNESHLECEIMYYENNFFVMRFIYAFELIIRNNTTHTITLNLFSEFQISPIIDNYWYFFQIFSIIDIKKSAQHEP